MEHNWRRFGWQRMSFAAPAEWFLTKISVEPGSGELWLSDAELPRLQIKWTDVTRQKQVNPQSTLTAYLTHIERSAKRNKLPFKFERDQRLGRPSQTDISSQESFHWTSEIESYGSIWYSPSAQRVTLVQINASLQESGLRQLAKRIIGSLRDASDGQLDLWTAQDLTCYVPHDFAINSQAMQTGQTELGFGRGRYGEKLTFVRYGLASIALERSGDLGDWVDQQRFKLFHTYRLERGEVAIGEHAAVRFTGLKRAWRERLRGRLYGWLGQRLPIALTAVAWHSPEANAITLVEHQHWPGEPSPAAELAAQTPDAPVLIAPPKG